MRIKTMRKPKNDIHNIAMMEDIVIDNKYLKDFDLLSKMICDNYKMYLATDLYLYFSYKSDNKTYLNEGLRTKEIPQPKTINVIGTHQITIDTSDVEVQAKLDEYIIQLEKLAQEHPDVRRVYDNTILFIKYLISCKEIYFIIKPKNNHYNMFVCIN